jgi:uncharacterized protein (TIGR02594 family)
MRLSPEDARKAARYNLRNASRVGWPARWTQIASILEIGPVSITAEEFAQRLADWQAANRPLTGDGMLGNRTWDRMEPLTRFSTAARPRPGWLPGDAPAQPRAPTLGPAGDAPWMQIAEAQMQRWDAEIAGLPPERRAVAERHLDWDEEYFAAAPYWGGRVHNVGDRPSTDRSPHWCAAFVNYCLHRTGYSHTGSAGAGSFVARGRWRFQALTSPRRGCIAVVGGGSPAHVAFLWEFRGLPDDPRGDVENDRSVVVKLLGGNQSQRVKISNEGRNLLAATDSRGVRSPYLWPEIGEATCNVDVPTARPHFCYHVHASA